MPQDYRAQVFKAIDYISQNLCFNPTLEEIASTVALSSFHFHRIFKAEVGETIAGFTRRLRMEKAAMWLIESPRRDITGLALRSDSPAHKTLRRRSASIFPYRPVSTDVCMLPA
ncbi:AraC family transcriptional regulator [Raoultella terrigena]